MRQCGRRLWRTTTIGVAVLACRGPRLTGQEPTGAPNDTGLLTVSPSFSSNGWVRADSSIVLTLSRPLAPVDGRLAIVVGSSDVTSLFTGSATTLRYRGHALRLPPGSSDVVVYSVIAGKWTELARAPIKVLTAAGFAAAELKPSVSFTNKGQLAEGHSGTEPRPNPATYQDFGFSGGLTSSHERSGWSVRTQSNYVGVTRQQDALRFGIRQEQAPKIDLSDYLLKLERGPAAVSLGHVIEGANRHLINSFASRGIEARIGTTSANVSLAALNGSSIVGWNNFTGLENSDHRVQSGTVNLELLPSRPGALHVDATLMNGSLLPQTSFTQGAVVDAERSTGEGLQVAASTPSQRLRFAGGVSRSRFVNPARDRELQGDTTIVAVRPEQRGAVYLEVTAGLLQNAAIPHLFSTTLNATYRRERVDPMYRSVAAQPQADRLQDYYEVTGNVGVFALTVSHGRDHDNLDNVPSILKTLDHLSTAQVSVPVASLIRSANVAAWLPVVNYGFNRVHQFGAGVPTNGDFSPSHVPNQQSDVHNGTAAWQVGRWRMQYRYNESGQDNRQPGRERADFHAVSSTIAVDVAARGNLDLGIEGSTEHQTNSEAAQTNRVRRAGGSLTWHATSLTTVTAFASTNVTRDDPLTNDAFTSDVRFEFSQGFDLWRTAVGGGTRGQLFLRYGKTTGIMWTFPPQGSLDRAARGAWMLSSGASFRLY